MAVFKKQYTKPLPRDAEVFEMKGQLYARWINQRGRKYTAEVFTAPDGSQRVRLTASTFTIKSKDTSGIVRETSSKCRTRSAAESVQSCIIRRRERVISGVLTHEEDTISSHAEAAISGLVTDYLRHLTLASFAPGHIAHVAQHLSRLNEDCGFVRLADLSADRLEKWLGVRRDEGMGARTRNTYRAAIHSFCEWCVRNGRLNANAFSRVPSADEKSDRRHQRRALTEGESARLLKAARLRPLAERGRTVQKTSPGPLQRKRSNWRLAPITPETLEEAAQRGRAALAGNPNELRCLERLGWERALIYKTLLLTGLRIGELASIRLSHVDLQAEHAFIELKAADEKNRRGSIIHIRADLATELRDFLAGRADAAFLIETQRNARRNADRSPLLFDIPNGLCNVMNRDLAAAGIPKRDVRGRVVDVHALRHTFGTNLCRAGVPLRTAQAAMRHSDPKLTANVYTDPALLDVAGAVDKLSGLPAANDVGLTCEGMKKIPETDTPGKGQSDADLAIA